MTSDVRSRMSDVRDSVRTEQVMVAVHDTIMETVTIVVRENEQGDTIRMSVMTERDRSRLMSDVRSKKEEMRAVHDTVYVERQDSVQVKDSGFTVHENRARASPVVSALKCIFWIIIAIGALTLLRFFINVK